MTISDTKIDRKIAFSTLISEAINNSPKSQNKIADEIGYTSNANVMTMFKKGVTRVPLDKVVPLAKAVNADPTEWLKMWFGAYMPDVLLSDLEEHIGFKISAQENSWVRGLRRLFDDRLPMFKDSMVDISPKE